MKQSRKDQGEGKRDKRWNVTEGNEKLKQVREREKEGGREGGRKGGRERERDDCRVGHREKEDERERERDRESINPRKYMQNTSTQASVLYYLLKMPLPAYFYSVVSDLLYVDKACVS